MSADRAAFLRAIAEHPDDDLPRLIYADWLDEHSEPERAEFIRVQCELARKDLSDSQRDTLRARESELLAANGLNWQPRQAPGVTVGRFERGFVGWVTVENFSAFMTVAEDLFAIEPVWRLGISRVRSQQARALARLPFLSGISSLILVGGSIGNAAVATLVSSRYLTQLSTLNLAGNRIGDVGAQTLAEATSLAGLRVLDLAFNPISDVGAEALAASQYLTRLTSLDLRGTLFGRDSRALLRARYGDAVQL